MDDPELVRICEKGIVAFWRARSRAENREYDAEDHLYQAEYLVENGDEGLRWGAPGWGHLKLRFTTFRGFYLDANGMPEKDFFRFQRIFSEELAKEGLPFYEMPA